MNRRSLKLRRLVLHRETLFRLDERRLVAAQGRGIGMIDPIHISRDDNCTSPLCVETTCNCGRID